MDTTIEISEVRFVWKYKFKSIIGFLNVRPYLLNMQLRFNLFTPF